MAAVLGNFFERLVISSCKQPMKLTARRFLLPVPARGLRSQPLWSTLKQQPMPAVQKVEPVASSQTQIAFKEISSQINSQIADQSHGRLFAVVQVLGKQFKVTDEDLIVLEGNWAPDTGDHIRLEKVLVVGGADFTLFGCPILPADLVHIEATVVEKTLTQTKTVFRKKRRKQYMRINYRDITVARLCKEDRVCEDCLFRQPGKHTPDTLHALHPLLDDVYRFPLTMLRINSVRLTGKVDTRQDMQPV